MLLLLHSPVEILGIFGWGLVGGAAAVGGLIASKKLWKSNPKAK